MLGVRLRFRKYFLLVFGLASLVLAQSINPGLLNETRIYIKHMWHVLERSNKTLLKSAVDTKVGQAGTLTLYVARDESPDAVTASLRRILAPAEMKRITVKQLPPDPESISEAGLLYLPHPYVVPGGRFNEMYGWDSYFTLLGLVRDGELQLAKDMTENFLYEIEHYGMILNANRTYYLTRSQPPFLTQMILEVYRRSGDLKWLEGTIPAIEKYYAYWLKAPHFTPETLLSHYAGGADTPASEVVHGERDANGKNQYDRVKEYYRTHKVTAYDVGQYYDRATDRLTPLFYEGDRAMRESGFDPSARFGPFSVDIIHYNSVDLNSLLYRMELDTSAIMELLDRPHEAGQWATRADHRAIQMNELMWNEKEGMYFDYDFVTHKESNYHFLTTFYPLWAGLASEEQAERLRSNLRIFEKAGGLETSDNVSGNQWDAPYGWAPLHILAVEGLRRYGFNDDADRISRKFLAMVVRDFEAHGTIKEKYDVVTARSDLAAGLKFGYTSNEAGFGWTNAAAVIFADELAARHELQKVAQHGALIEFARR
ncbi:MAG: trehalase family glycosidase [Bryobacteraceae bacterium]